eukprot:scaffold22384_cov21-Tisochrysis_lutea.AAC.1
MQQANWSPQMCVCARCALQVRELASKLLKPNYIHITAGLESGVAFLVSQVGSVCVRVRVRACALVCVGGNEGIGCQYACTRACV